MAEGQPATGTLPPQAQAGVRPQELGVGAFLGPHDGLVVSRPPALLIPLGSFPRA